MTNANPDQFFRRVSKELTRRTPHDASGILTIDENLAIHVPARLIARYNTDAGVDGYWDAEHGTFAVGFVKKPDEPTQDVEFAGGETVAIDGIWFFTELFPPIGKLLGKLPARFAYVVRSPDRVAKGKISGPSTELIVVALQWRQD